MEKRFEQIGKVCLDLKYYNGEDLYSEGSAEDELLEIVKAEPPENYNRIIAQRANWSVLYHLSDIRGNIVDFIHIQKEHKVLEIGSGCGAVTSTLAKKAGSVTCIELSHKRSLINAYRNRDIDNIDIIVGNFEDIEPDLEEKYDYIFLIGVLEYAGMYIHSKDPYNEILKRLSSHLALGGEIVCAIENKYGLKYISGCREDHTGGFYDGIEGYRGSEGVRTFSHKGMCEIAKAAGLRAEFYYPYPDYKLPTTIFSNERLPRTGELTDNIRNFDADRFVVFDEAKVYDEVLREGAFPSISNSFLVFMSKEDRIESFKVKKTLFSRHSDERDPKYQIRTDILEDGYHKRFVMKYPKTLKAQEHLLNMYSTSAKMAKLASRTVRINKARIVTDENGDFEGIQFEYLSGRTLEEVLADQIKKGLKGSYEKILKQYASFVRAKRPIDLDLIFSNIIITPDGAWNITDYEWTEEDCDPEFIIYRAARYFLEENKDLIPEPDLYGILGLDLSDKAGFDEKEIRLQQKIAGDHASLKIMYDIFGSGYVTLAQAVTSHSMLLRAGRVKLYFDTGSGFSEDETMYYTGDVSDDMKVSLDLPLKEGTVRLRVDPMDGECMIRLICASIPDAMANGHVCGNTVIYDHDDPQLVFEGVSDIKSFHLEYTIRTVDNDMSRDIGRMLEEYETPDNHILGRRPEKKVYVKVSAVDRKN